ncbi:MAG: apolipoprotein N-acyltransferase, partial [Actinobacteria bacterium]|nr:apolipoprotein N-acyltransferase [Actinomycetota bacterium]
MGFWHRLTRALGQPVRWASLLAGALPVLAYPAPNLELLAWFGLVPGLLLMRIAPSAREAAVRAWWFGTGFMLAAHYWLVPNIGPGLLLAAVAFGALWTGVGVSTNLMLRAPVTAGRALAALLVVPSYWLVVEWIRSWQGFAGPWALLGTTQWQHPDVLSLAAIGGVWLVSFAVAAVNTGILIALVAGRLRVRLLAAAVAVVAAAAGPAAFALTPAVTPQRPLTVSLVQPGVIKHPKPHGYASVALSQRLRSRHQQLIVWGESSIGADLRRTPRLLAQIEALSRANGAPILVSQDSIVSGGHSKVALLVTPHGITGSYTKTRLVPFGEYIPFRGELGWLTSISKAASSNMIPGHGAKVLTVRPPGTRPVRIGVLICFESAFPDMSRVDARRGAELIVYQTSDSTFQQSWAPAQHASYSAVRAAETGRPVVQAALTGNSVAFDSRGRLLASMGTSQHGVTTVRLGLPPRGALTPFDRIGDVVPATALTAAALAALAALIGWLRRRPHHPLTAGKQEAEEQLTGERQTAVQKQASQKQASQKRERVAGRLAAGKPAAGERSGGMPAAGERT